MENNIPCPESPRLVSGVRWKQTTAGVLFVLNYVLLILSNFVPQLLMFTISRSEYGDVTRMSATIITYPLFMLCAFLLLHSLSVNRVVRLATLVLTITYGVTLAVRVLGFLIFNPNSALTLFSCVNIVLTFASIFSFACILKNCAQFLGSARVWVQFILCCIVTNIIDIIYNLMLVTIPEGVDIMQVIFTSGLFYGIFHILLFILLAIAYYKFAKSELFSGVFDDSPVPIGACSIVNKYWATVLVVIVLSVFAMYFVLSNADKLLNF